MPRPQQQEKPDAVSLLDDLIPLRGASHAQVVEYCVEIPMRYAECVALLDDGRKVALAQPRRFIGWSGHGEDRTLLFRNSGSTLELGLSDSDDAPLPGKIRNIVFDALAPRGGNSMKKFIGIDGGLVYQSAV